MMESYPDAIQLGGAFQVREEAWTLPHDVGKERL